MSGVAAVFADGGCIQANPSPYGITWSWRHVDAYDLPVTGDSGVIEGAGLTNNLAEFVALVRGLEALPDGWSGHVCSDSGVSLGRLFRGWTLRGLPPEWIARGARVLQRLGTLEPVLLSGHPTKRQLAAGVGKHGYPVSLHNVWTDQECTRQAAEYRLRVAV